MKQTSFFKAKQKVNFSIASYYLPENEKFKKNLVYKFILFISCFTFFTQSIQAQYTELTAGGTSPLSNKTNSILSSGATSYMLPVDYDVDGDIDFIVANSTGSGWHLLRNNGGVYNEETTTTINLSPAVDGSPLGEPYDFWVIDYDGDGDDDIIDPLKGGDDDAAIFRNDGAGVFTELTAGGTSPLSNKTNSILSSGATSYMLPVDYDVDGDIDFIVANSTGSGWHLLRNNGGVYNEETTTTINLSPAVDGSPLGEPYDFWVIDYDGDGDDDIIDPLKGGDDDAAIFRNDGAGVFTELTAGGTSPLSNKTNSILSSGATSYMLPVDYDVDGDIDFIVANSTGSGWHLLRNNGGVYNEETTTTINLSPAVDGSPLGEPYDFWVVDYDGDWDDDIIDPLKGGDDDAAIFQNTNSPPALSSSTPTDGATDFPENADLVLNFNETITLGTGNIEIRRVSDNSVVEAIDVTSTILTGGTQLTINPTSNLPIGVDLYVHIDAGAVIDTENEITVSLRNQPTTLNFQAILASNPISAPIIFHLDPVSKGAFSTDLLGGDETSIVTYTASASSFAADIELDEANGHIYVLDRNADELRRYNLDGTNNTLIYTYSLTPQDIALDLTNNLIYHTETQTGPSEVFTTDLNGGSKNTVIAYTAVLNALAYLKIELDVANNHMYLLNSPGDELVRFDTDGTNPQSITSYTTQQDAFELDLTNNLIYHVDRSSGGEVFTTNLLGGARNSLFTYTPSGSSLYKEIELDVANDHMYLLNTNGDVLTRFNTDGTNQTTIFSYASGDNVQDIFLAGLGTSSTPSPPTITTTTQTNVTATTADLGGNVTDDGGESVTDRGIVWNTSTAPTTSNNKVQIGTGTGIFNQTVTGLPSATTVFVRSYAINNEGTSYGSEISFTTLSAPCSPTIGTTGFEGLGYTNAPPTTLSSQGTGVSGAGISASVSNQACWDIYVETYSPPALTLQISGTGNQGVSNSASVNFSISNGGFYSFTSNDASEFDLQSIAVLAIAGSPTNDVTFTITGYRNGSLVTGANYTQGGTGNTYLTMSGINSNNSFDNIDEFRVTAQSTVGGQEATVYKIDNIIIAPAVTSSPPTVTTTAQANVTATTADLGGNVTDDGGATVTDRGIVWNTSAAPTTSNNKVQIGTGTGVFNQTVTGLPSATTVFVRSYAINGEGTSYGNEISFTTLTACTGAIAQTIDFESESFTDFVDYGSQTYESGKMRIIVSGSNNWFEDTDGGSSGGKGITAFILSEVGTVTVETCDGSEFDFESFYYNNFTNSSEIASIEGFRDTNSTGTQIGVPISSIGIVTLNNKFNNVDRVVITSGADGFADTFDEFIFNAPVTCTAPTGQVTNLMAGNNPTSTTLDVASYSAPAGGGADGYVIKINSTNSFTAPTNSATLPTADLSWNDAGEQVVYAGTSTNPNIVVTGLSSSTTYFFRVYAYNDCAGTNTFETTGTGESGTTTEPPTITATITSVSCAGGNTGAIDLDVSEFSGSQSYAWSDGGITTQNRTGLAVGEYEITITDGGNDYTATYEVGYDLTWTDLTEFTVVDKKLTKSTATTGWTTKAFSEGKVVSDGGIVFTAEESDNAYMVGLSYTKGATGFASIDYAIYLTSAATVVVYEKGVLRGGFGSYQNGDIFEIKRVGATLQYTKNGTAFRTVGGVLAGDLIADATMLTANGRIPQVQFTSCPVALEITSFTSNTCPTDGAGAATATLLGEALPTTYAWSSGENTASISSKNTGIYSVTATGVYGTRTRHVAIGYEVDFQNQTNVSVAGNVLTKTNATGWTSGATSASTQQLSSAANGWVSNTITNNTSFYMVGLAKPNAIASYTSIDYAWYFVGNGKAIPSYNKNRGTAVGYQTGDVFTVAREGNQMKFYKNGNVVQQYVIDASETLVADVAINSGSTGQVQVSFCGAAGGAQTYTATVTGIDCSTGATTGSIDIEATGATYLWSTGETSQDISALDAGTYQLELTKDGITYNSSYLIGAPLTWTNLTNLALNGDGQLDHTSITGWNTNANSTQNVKADGGVVFKVDNTTTASMIGLSKTEEGTGFSAIDYAIYTAANGKFYVFENGANKGDFGTYQTGDGFKIQRGGTQIQYFKNGTVFYTSTSTATTDDLVVDASLYTANATLPEVLFTGCALDLTVSAPLLDCSSSTGSATATLTGGTFTTSYDWKNAAGTTVSTTSTLSNQPAGYYTVTASGSFGSFTKSVVLSYPIDFVVEANATSTGAVVSKTTSTTTWDAGIHTANTLNANQDGFVENTASENVNYMFGLTLPNTNPSYTSINYKWYVLASGKAIANYGTASGVTIDYKKEDKLRVERVGSLVKYFHNNVEITQQSIDPSEELVADIAIYTSNGNAGSYKISFCPNPATRIATKVQANQNDFEEDTFSIYPNPSRGTFNVRFATVLSTNTQVTILDAIGRTIKTKTVEKGSQKFTIDLKNQPKGMYLIHFNQNGATYSKTVIIE
ncbi:T9SS type A sorting domain-containing protein [Bernardetia sp. ABR2-2B]|uniref:T9SS type A sorting domain-containing protein n=1 Tax=Bernardetia sp. ABR2-2B TaxID=3127472 RepID=UPI0030D39998